MTDYPIQLPDYPITDSPIVPLPDSPIINYRWLVTGLFGLAVHHQNGGSSFRTGQT